MNRKIDIYEIYRRTDNTVSCIETEVVNKNLKKRK
jgi:hypothetical protein